MIAAGGYRGARGATRQAHPRGGIRRRRVRRTPDDVVALRRIELSALVDRRPGAAGDGGQAGDGDCDRGLEVRLAADDAVDWPSEGVFLLLDLLAVETAVRASTLAGAWTGAGLVAGAVTRAAAIAAARASGQGSRNRRARVVRVSLEACWRRRRRARCEPPRQRPYGLVAERRRCRRRGTR